MNTKLRDLMNQQTYCVFSSCMMFLAFEVWSLKVYTCNNLFFCATTSGNIVLNGKRLVLDFVESYYILNRWICVPRANWKICPILRQTMLGFKNVTMQNNQKKFTLIAIYPHTLYYLCVFTRLINVVFNHCT